MGVLASVIRFLRSPRSRADSSIGENPVVQAPPLHWPGSGRFAVAAVGESFYKDAIRRIARNINGEPAFVACTAVLHPEADNEYDANAVAVYIQDTKVGHLRRQMAIDFRAALAKNRIVRLTSCDAVIHGGGAIRDRQFDYSIELDINLEDNIGSFDAEPAHPEPVALGGNPTLIKHTDTEFRIRVPYVKLDTLSQCSEGCDLTPWEKPGGNEVHLFAPRSVGGSGRVAVLARTDFPELIRGWDKYRYLTVYRIDGRSIIVRGGTECDPRYAFKQRQLAKVAIIHVDQRNPTVPLVGAVTLEIDLGKGNGKTVPGSYPRPALFGTRDSHVRMLMELIQSADVIVSYDMASEKSALKRLLNQTPTDKPWGCLRTFWERRGNEDPIHSLDAICEQCHILPGADDGVLAQCQLVADVLLTHTGKTKRSRTYVAELLNRHI